MWDQLEWAPLFAVNVSATADLVTPGSARGGDPGTWRQYNNTFVVVVSVIRRQ
jgi:hypothetical protein